MAELNIDRVTKSFGETEVLKGISLTIQDGEFVSLVGPSGCGKSTLLRIIAGLEQQSSGDIQINGQSVAGVRAADRNLSMVFQSYALYPHLSVEENIAVPLRMRQLTAAQRLPILGPFVPGARTAQRDINAAVLEAAETLEIDQLLKRKPGQLSGGQRQRVALGRALVRHPEAFLLDEPLSNLDAKLRVQTRSEIAELHRRLGATFIYVTHDQVEAMTMSSRIAVMMAGEILQCAPPAELYEDPEDIRVAEFVGSPKINILAMDTIAGELVLLNQRLGLVSPGEGTKIGLRPEHLSLGAAALQISGTVAHMENLGSEIYTQVDVPQLESRIVFRAEPKQRASVEIGEAVQIGFDPADALIFDATGKRVRGLTPQPAVAKPRREPEVA